METNFKNVLKTSALAIALALSFTSCSKNDDDEKMEITASLMVVNSVEGSAAQDFYLNDSKSNNALSYGSSASVNTTAGTQTAVFKNTGSTMANATANISVNANANQTIFFVKQADGSFGISTYADDNTTASGKARVRFINISPVLSGAVNITTSTGTSILSSLTFKAASAYQTIDANTALNVNMVGSLETTTIAGSEFKAGKVYTVWFDSATSTKAKYHVIVQN